MGKSNLQREKNKMPRKFKKHEKILLKHQNFFEWESDNGHQAEKIIKRYHLKNRNEYVIYNKIAKEARELAKKIRDLEPSDPFRIRATAQLLDKLYCDSETKATRCFGKIEDGAERE